MDCRLLFVYGTLRRGGSRHRILKALGARFVGRGSVGGELFDLGEYPGARPTSSPRARVFGELYELRNPQRALKVLDRIEGYRPDDPAASLFRRDIATVRPEGGAEVDAWLYWLGRGTRFLRRIPSGDYIDTTRRGS
ncbi:MAG: gamma-glutamylcyclotransferase [Acidobacteriia bacterium]|nr:gamma-glutamylcyclotransferase [Terriglobia bacterium]